MRHILDLIYLETCTALKRINEQKLLWIMLWTICAVHIFIVKSTIEEVHGWLLTIFSYISQKLKRASEHLLNTKIFLFWLIVCYFAIFVLFKISSVDIGIKLKILYFMTIILPNIWSSCTSIIYKKAKQFRKCSISFYQHRFFLTKVLQLIHLYTCFCNFRFIFDPPPVKLDPPSKQTRCAWQDVWPIYETSAVMLSWNVIYTVIWVPFKSVWYSIYLNSCIVLNNLLQHRTLWFWSTYSKSISLENVLLNMYSLGFSVVLSGAQTLSTDYKPEYEYGKKIVTSGPEILESYRYVINQQTCLLSGSCVMHFRFYEVSYISVLN